MICKTLDTQKMNLFGIFGFLSTSIAIDLGTANTLIYIPDRGIVLNEPTVVAYLRRGRMQNPVIAEVGLGAKQMLGRTPDNVTTIRPLKDGVIADIEVTNQMLHYFIKKVNAKKRFSQLKAVVCVPCRSNMVERQAIRNAALNAGASEVYLLEEPMAAAIGAGIPIHDANGAMLVDIGGGTTEIAVIALSGCVYADSLRVGGDLFNETIVHYVRKKHGCVIGEETAEKILHEIGAALVPVDEKVEKAKVVDRDKYKSKSSKVQSDLKVKKKDTTKQELEVYGRSVADGIPTSIVVTTEEIQEALVEPVTSIISGVRDALERTPPELAADIAERGIMLTGGGALLRNLDKLLSKETGLPVSVADDPLTCVCRGGGKALEFINDKRRNMIFV